MLQASTPIIRIGEQFDDARESTKLSGGAEPTKGLTFAQG